MMILIFVASYSLVKIFARYKSRVDYYEKKIRGMTTNKRVVYI